MDPNRANNAGSLGSWTQDDLRRTASLEVGVGADSGLPDEVRFVGSVAKLLRRRIASGKSASDPVSPAIFLLHPNIEAEKLGKAPKRMPKLSSGEDTINGRLWFVSAAVRSGKCVDITQPDLESLFDYITGDLVLGDTPAVFFDPNVSPLEFSFYPKGLNEEELFEDFSIDIADVSMAKIIQAIDITHGKHLITPEIQNKLMPIWKNRNKWYPVEKAEESVQFYLHVGLSSAFPTCTVRPEQTQKEGRLDLEIIESDFLEPSKVTNHAVIELKVLRSYGSTGDSVSQNEIDEWISSGLRQAYAYRAGRGALKSALFCFDMRKTDTADSCFNHVLADAAALSVEVRRWYMYPTSAHYRAALAKKVLGT